MNSKDEIQEAFDDYNQTNFGGWNWKNSAPVHGYKKERFAKFIYDKVNPFIEEETEGRVKIAKVEFREHNKNSTFH